MTRERDRCPFPTYFYDIEKEFDKDLEEIFVKSGLSFYPELFHFNNFSPIFVNKNKFIHLYRCEFYNGRRYLKWFSKEKEYIPSYLYYKDILVKDFDTVGALIPYAYDAFGFLNYIGKEIELSVSRNEIIGGLKSINLEFKKILLKYKTEKESNEQIKEFILKILEYYGENSAV